MYLTLNSKFHIDLQMRTAVAFATSSTRPLYLEGLGPTEAQQSSQSSGLLDLLYDWGGLGRHDPLLHHPKHLPAFLFSLLYETVRHVQDPDQGKTLQLV